MAKAKKVKTSEDEKKNSEVVNSETQSKNVDNKPAKKLKKISKPRIKHEPFSEMVTAAFTDMKNRQGHSLDAIRRYIISNYGLEMTKQRQGIIKKFMENEFKDGRIVMTNHDGVKIHFKKRFKMVFEKPPKN